MEDNKKSDTAKRIKVKRYRFQPPLCERLEKLAKGSLWFSDPKTFNDPMDMRLDVKDLTAARWSKAEAFRTAIKQALQCLLNEKKEFGRALLFDKELIDSLHEYANPSNVNEDDWLVPNALQKRIDQFGVACLMRTYDSRLMWAHYAESGKGFCIEYEINPWQHTEDVRYIPVQYVSDLSPLCITEAMFSPHQFLLRAIGTKHVDWAYEREVRLVALNQKGVAVAVNENFVKLTALIGGYTMSPCLEMYLKETGKRLDVPVYKAEFSSPGEIVARHPLR
jgi:hypothetical protein